MLEQMRVYLIKVIDLELQHHKTIDESKDEGTDYLTMYGWFLGESKDHECWLFGLIKYDKNDMYDVFLVPKTTLKEFYLL